MKFAILLNKKELIEKKTENLAAKISSKNRESFYW